jgi:hypothetical protein
MLKGWIFELDCNADVYNLAMMLMLLMIMMIMLLMMVVVVVVIMTMAIKVFIRYKI